ncbi:unnamed protein product [Soboliphyme baturini]|uniref:Secreted protein n=1 Tax=Soboliphyme baturini TaxID=241478 RepID=A0A183IQG3_9BILA|nr:unnamed protein product [Soboliphyme baturini]
MVIPWPFVNESSTMLNWQLAAPSAGFCLFLSSEGVFQFPTLTPLFKTDSAPVADWYLRRLLVDFRQSSPCCYSSLAAKRRDDDSFCRLFVVCLKSSTANPAIGNPGDNRFGIMFDNANAIRAR